MDFGIPRSQMLELLADAMEVPEGRRTALLGRFQHLQRLSLIDGINPGRGKAAEYRANQVLIIAVAFEMLQIGLTPERAVRVIKHNEDELHCAIWTAVKEEGEISPSIIWFDPLALNGEEVAFNDDYTTFSCGDRETAVKHFEWLVTKSRVERNAVISISGTLWHIAAAFEGHRSHKESPIIGPRTRQFLESLRRWCLDSSSGAFE